MSKQTHKFKNTVSPEVERLVQVAETVAASRATVLIIGESGCGKELLARFIHDCSHRKNSKFVAINCAAVPDGLLESELFGYEKGAFTGAVGRKLGKLESAKGGTFLLDEISELPLPLQAKLLRVIQEGEVERLGGHESIKIDIRLIATSNKSLKDLVDSGEFRKDLYYRLNVIPLEIPPLRKRPEDVPLLANAFLKKSCQENKRNLKVLSPAAIKKLVDWSWPGNIRELQNVIERAVLLSSLDVIGSDKLSLMGERIINEENNFRPGTPLVEAEKWLILKTLQHTNNNRTQAARLLGISIRTLRNKLKEYKGLETV